MERVEDARGDLVDAEDVGAPDVPDHQSVGLVAGVEHHPLRPDRRGIGDHADDVGDIEAPDRPGAGDPDRRHAEDGLLDGEIAEHRGEARAGEKKARTDRGGDHARPPGDQGDGVELGGAARKACMGRGKAHEPDRRGHDPDQIAETGSGEPAFDRTRDERAADGDRELAGARQEKRRADVVTLEADALKDRHTDRVGDGVFEQQHDRGGEGEKADLRRLQDARRDHVEGQRRGLPGPGGGGGRCDAAPDVAGHAQPVRNDGRAGRIWGAASVIGTPRPDPRAPIDLTPSDRAPSGSEPSDRALSGRMPSGPAPSPRELFLPSAVWPCWI